MRRIEFILLCAFTATLWFASPERDRWAFLLLPAGWMVASHALTDRKLYGHSRFPLPLATLLGLCIISIYTSPYPTREWVLLFRPAAGLWIFAVWVEVLQRPKGERWASFAAGALTTLILIMGLTAIQWTGKAANFAAITDLLPDWRAFFWWSGGFNVNEWSGAVTWLLPALVGIGAGQPNHGRWRAAAVLAGTVLGILLFMGQSLSGLAGVAAGVALLLVPMRWKSIALIGAGAVLIIANAAVLALPRQSADLLAAASGQPGDRSLAHRAVMWERAQNMIIDYPWTGVGIANYRQLRAVYGVPGFEAEPLPHPHNEALQFGTDLGIPGLVVYGWLALLAGQCAWNVQKHGTAAERVAALALTAGLLAHAVYGLTDAIPIWDRFAFVLWWVLGLLAGLDRKVSERESAPRRDTQSSA